MSGSRLDQIVKGAPPPGTSVPSVVSRSPSPAPSNQTIEPPYPRSPTPVLQSDPLTALPSSPPQIYLNLLILEASLRSQYLTLRARRRQNTFFLLLLSVWIAWFAYLLFLRPREDGSGVGGSVYWVVEMGEKVALMGGVVTGVLVWGTGQWERGVRWPRRWVGIANRGLRNINAKIIVIKGPWWKEMLGHLAFLFPYSSFFPSQGASYHFNESTTEKQIVSSHHSRLEDDGDELLREEDLSPGGDYIKLLLLPKPFSPDFRENWELYRLEYWEKENERRAHLREVVRKRRKGMARRHGGWFFETSEHSNRLEKDRKRQSYTRKGSHSRSTSRSRTPSNLGADDRPGFARTRRGSTTASGSERRRRVKPSVSPEDSTMSKFTPIDQPA